MTEDNFKTALDRVLELHHMLTSRGAELLAKKAVDYSGQTDLFRNFRAFGGVGILVRLSDKLSRLRTFEEVGKFQVSDETVVDTAVDAINYVVLLLAWWEEEKNMRFTLSGTDSSRCAVCGWRLLDEGSDGVGCVRGNCSLRPQLRPERLYDQRRAEQERQDFLNQTAHQAGPIKGVTP